MPVFSLGPQSKDVHIRLTNKLIEPLIFQLCNVIDSMCTVLSTGMRGCSPGRFSLRTVSEIAAHQSVGIVLPSVRA